MKAMLIKSAKGLIGATQADHDAWAKFKRRLLTMKAGTWLKMEWVRPRNAKHHRKFFALLNLIAENSEVYDTTDKALVAVKLCTGHFDLLAHPETGEIIQVVRSIAYDSMDQDEFDRWYSQAIDGVLRHILPTMDRETADSLMDMIAEGWA